jgi:hypothetical protein
MRPTLAYCVRLWPANMSCLPAPAHYRLPEWHRFLPSRRPNFAAAVQGYRSLTLVEPARSLVVSLGATENRRGDPKAAPWLPLSESLGHFS